MTTVNFYDVLEVAQDCSRKDIKSSYRKLLKKHHPERGGDPDDFKLITKAYEILKEPESRIEYDKILKLSLQSDTDHFKMRESSNAHYKGQKGKNKVKSKKELEKDLKKIKNEFDRKHGYDRTKEDAYSEQDFNKRLRDLRLARDDDEREFIPENLFEGMRFDDSKFNAVWDKMYKGPMEMIEHSGNPDAWGGLNDFGSSFSSINNYDDIYLDDDKFGHSTKFGTVNFDNKNTKKLTKEEIKGMDGVAYYDVQNDKMDEDEFEQLIKRRLNGWSEENRRIENKEFHDFDTDPSCGGYGIFYDLGVTNTDLLQWNNDDDDEIRARYNRLLAERKLD